MAKRSKSDFVRDREFNAVPDIHAPLEEKIAWQKYLQRRWQAAAEKPSACLDIPLEQPGKWWTSPAGMPDEYVQMQIKKQLKRYANER